MQIHGYICHNPAHKPNFKDGKVIVKDQPLDLPHGTVVGLASLKLIPNVSWSTYLRNQMYMQIQFFLEESGFVNLQRKGFHWMLHYYQEVHPIVPYVQFIIGNTEGHDCLCRHYTARFASVKHLCRACECPTLESEYSNKGRYRHRKPRLINKQKVCADILERLQAMSQNYLHNGFHRVRFGLHNNWGIFGACTGKILHLISPGWFKYCLQGYAAQAGGPKSLAF
jgi:hypothetical protein